MYVQLAGQQKTTGAGVDTSARLQARFLFVTFDLSWLDSVDVNATPVQVIGWQDEGVWNYPNLEAARKEFPELDPYKSTSRFTAAMSGRLQLDRCAAHLGLDHVGVFHIRRDHHHIHVLGFTQV